MTQAQFVRDKEPDEWYTRGWTCSVCEESFFCESQPPVACPSCGSGSESEILQARDDALEEAAKVADEGNHDCNYGDNCHPETAKSIRALKSKPEAK